MYLKLLFCRVPRGESVGETLYKGNQSGVCWLGNEHWQAVESMLESLLENLLERLLESVLESVLERP